jgi:hypothetical protein
MAAAGTNPLPGFWDAAFQGDLSSLRDHIPSGVDVNAWPPAWKSAYQPTALSYAVWGNQAAAVKLLLQSGADPNRPDGVRPPAHASGASPPCPCAARPREFLCQREGGEEPSPSVAARLQDGNYHPLHWASYKSDHAECAQVLVRIAARAPSPPVRDSPSSSASRVAISPIASTVCAAAAR